MPFHRWYPYIEGFSAQYVRGILHSVSHGKSIYDPFGGSGTTLVEASIGHFPSFYSEINPFMRFVAETKVNATRLLKRRWSVNKELLSAFTSTLRTRISDTRSSRVDLRSYYVAFPGRNYFVERDLKKLLAARDFAREITERNDACRELLFLAIASVTVDCSNMTRRADLRRRRGDEYKKRVVDVATSIESKVKDMISDIESSDCPVASTTRVSDDALKIPDDYNATFDLAVTSPPYLNGTNYFRNTKLELWLLDFIRSEQELALFRARAVPSGITEVSRSTSVVREFATVEEVANKIEDSAYDRRIPLLVRAYFDRLYVVLEKVFVSLKPGGKFILDIGDSKFCGVSVPTDLIVCGLARSVGFRHVETKRLAVRFSRDKTRLKQVEISMSRPDV